MYHSKLLALIFCDLIILACGGGGGSSAPRLSTDATPSNLTVSAGTFSPVFQPTTTSYTLTVGNVISSSSVTATLNHLLEGYASLHLNTRPMNGANESIAIN